MNENFLISPNTVSDFTWDENDHFAKGSTCDVYCGRHKQSGTRVAVKVLKRSITKEERNEISILNKFSHENIVKVYAFGEAQQKGFQGRHVIITEFCSEGSLTDILCKCQNGLNDNDFVLLLKCLSNCFRFLQRNGVLHRDIKPLNICCHIKEEDQEKVFKIIDFGLAKTVYQGQKWSDSTYKAGTPHYWHPRVNARWLKNGEPQPVTYSTKEYIDLWPIGATLYEAATGQMAFQVYHGNRSSDAIFQNLQKAFEVKEPGTICMKQEKDKSWIQYKSLPNDVTMSDFLVKTITPMLAGLLEKEVKDMWSVDRFLLYCDTIEELMEKRNEWKIKKNQFIKRLNKVKNTNTILTFSDCPTRQMLLLEKSYCIFGFNPLLCDKYGEYPTIEWTKETNRGSRDWNDIWNKILQKKESYLDFPPLLLPIELGGWMMNLCLKWFDGQFMLGGSFANHEYNQNCPQNKEIPLEIDISINEQSLFFINKTFCLYKYRKSLSSNVFDLFSISKIVDDNWNIPIVRVKVHAIL